MDIDDLLKNNRFPKVNMDNANPEYACVAINNAICLVVANLMELLNASVAALNPPPPVDTTAPDDGCLNTAKIINDAPARLVKIE